MPLSRKPETASPRRIIAVVAGRDDGSGVDDHGSWVSLTHFTTPKPNFRISALAFRLCASPGFTV